MNTREYDAPCCKPIAKCCRLTKDLHFEMHVLPIMRMIHAQELKIDLLGCKLRGKQTSHFLAEHFALFD